MSQIPANWQKPYFLILAGQAVSLLTSSALQMALILKLTSDTGSPMVLSLATLAGFLPQAVFGPFIGVWVDRLDRKRIMILSDLLIALAALALAVVSLSGALPVWSILLVLFVRSCGAAFHGPAMSSVTPLMVPADMLTKAAGYAQSIQSVSLVLSPVLGALVFALWPLTVVLLMDVAGALVAILPLMLFTIPGVRPEAAPAQAFFSELKQGFRLIRKEPGLRVLIIMGTLFVFLFMPINALFPLMSMGHFQGTAFHAAAAEVAFAAGMLLGGLLLGVWGGFRRKTRTILLAFIVMGAALTVAGLLPRQGFIPFAACCLMMGASSPLYNTQNAIIQQRVPPEYLGRVFSLIMSLMSLAMPFGLLVSGALAEYIGVSGWFLLSGIAVLAIGAVGFVLPALKQLDSQLDADAAQKAQAQHQMDA